MEVNTGVTTTLLLLAISVYVCYILYKWFQSSDYPPGPAGLPLIGYGPFLGKEPHKKLNYLSKKYGDIFSFYIGPQLVVVINEYETAKEILNHPKAMGRPPHSFDVLTGKGGFFGMNGEEWVEQRRFAVQCMRNLGLGKGLWETMIREDSVDFVNEMLALNGIPTYIDGPLSFSEAKNNISLLLGRHLDKTENKADIDVIRRITNQLTMFLSPVSVDINVPLFTKFREKFQFADTKQFFKLLRTFENIFKREIAERLKSKEDLTKEDFIGCYLQEIEKRRNDPKSNFFTEENLLGNMIILFLAGYDSTMSSINWLMLLMAHHQDIQKKIHQEIDSVIGRDGTVYYDDKVKLPYTVATIREMTRWVAINPVNPPRYVFETFHFKGYTIPKGCHILSNTWTILHDPRHHKEPMKFNPDRFLEQNGTKVAAIPGYTAFSYGKRNCPGEQVAMMTIYIYFVHIMQRFRVTVAPGKSVDFRGIFSGALMPKPQKLCLIER